ncbi:MAG TPA: universal stress protein [Myxococcales bacterium]|nr:universal stress protein [Myxococcales bacterium]
MRILVGVDGSEPAHRAARRAFSLASRLGESVTLVHVLPPPPIFSEPAVVLNIADLERRLYEAGRGTLDKVEAEGRAAGVQVDTQLLSGPAPEMIAEAAQPDDVDFVVVGSRGRTLVGSILLGGTAHRLVHVCKKPVLIVH